jgi:hypothetical protein
VKGPIKMAKKSKDEEVEVALDTPENQPELELEITEKPELVEDKVSDNDRAIADLKKQLEAERTARYEAENRARQSNNTAAKAETDVHQANLHLVNGAIESMSRETEILKANYANAMANGDHEQAANINYAMSETASKLNQLRLGKESLESQTPQRVQPMERRMDPVEEFASQLSPRSADWVRAHPQCVTDPRLMTKMISAHNIATADGIPADSDEYFEFVEETLKMTPRRAEPVQDAEPVMSAASAPTQRRASPAATPVSRSGNGTGTPTNRATLTREQADMAKMTGMTPAEYHKNMMDLKKEGKMN